MWELRERPAKENEPKSPATPATPHHWSRRSCQRGRVGSDEIVGGDLRLACHYRRAAVTGDIQVDPRHGAAQDVGDEDLGRRSLVVNRQIPNIKSAPVGKAVPSMLPALIAFST